MRYIHRNFFLSVIAGMFASIDVGAQSDLLSEVKQQIPVFDVSLQAVNPDWFVRAMGGIDYGIHVKERYGEMIVDADELLSQTLAEMDRNGIRYGILSHGAHIDKWQAAHPDRFLLTYIPDLTLDDHTEAAAQFAEGVANGKYVALGELGLVYAGIPLNSPDLFPYYEVAQEHDIPVFIHTGFSGPNPQQVLSPAFRIATANPLLLEDVLIRFPDLKVVMMHMGWPFFDEALYMLGTYPNVYMETSVAIWVLGPALFNRMLKEAVTTAGSDRIVYGSLQMVWPNVIGRSVNAIRNADYLTAEDKHAILWGNAARLLGLEKTVEKLAD
jgi:uncharacterized protein